MTYDEWFADLTGHHDPHPWQSRLAAGEACEDRLIRIPTGLGKTEGAIAAWAWHRLVRKDDAWPRRLVWCLPMRVLVEQTAALARRIASRIASSSGAGVVPVVRLMGGVTAEEWHLYPERPAILVGTQDMLLSRALNRGYAAGRARWPIDYGLLNHDCLWVMDEVQLMDVGLATSVQLQAFRRDRPSVRPCHTWWMSATLKPAWLETVDSASWLPGLTERLQRVEGPGEGGPWSGTKPLSILDIRADDDGDHQAFAEAVLEAHDAADPGGRGRMTLAIVNRVRSARQVHGALARLLSERGEGVDLRLVHSRFRGMERAHWPEQFLNRATSEDPNTNRIVVATQVVEAGVDISATALVTELAPWPSLVQRFGRAARYGGTALVRVVDRRLTGKATLPYDEAELSAARRAVSQLDSVGLARIEQFEAELAGSESGLLAALYPYEPAHVLSRRENEDLFDTSPDLTGSDLDVSRFIRSGDERDVSVFWVPVPESDRQPGAERRPARDELCPVPVAEARSWLLDKSGRLKSGYRAWVWDYVDGGWVPLRGDACYPGQVIAVHVGSGGYNPLLGFTGAVPRKSDPAIPLMAPADASAAELADQAQPRDDLSAAAEWKTIVTHGREFAEVVSALAGMIGLEPNTQQLLALGGLLHDLGKAHPSFAACIGDSETAGPRPPRPDLAKAPQDAWAAPRELYRDERHGRRRGFRHELATALALFEILWQTDPDHEALLGPHLELIAAGGFNAVRPPPETQPTPLGSEIARLSGAQFDLLCHLVSSHHGKVRGAWHATPRDQEFPQWDASLVGTGQPLNGIREGDRLPSIPIGLPSGAATTVPVLTLHLDPASLGLSSRYGASWPERLHALVARHGPFALAYLESVFRAADVRSSRTGTPDAVIQQEGVQA